MQMNDSLYRCVHRKIYFRYRLKILSNGERVYEGFEAESEERGKEGWMESTPVEHEPFTFFSSRDPNFAEGISSSRKSSKTGWRLFQASRPLFPLQALMTETRWDGTNYFQFVEAEKIDQLKAFERCELIDLESFINCVKNEKKKSSWSPFIRRENFFRRNPSPKETLQMKRFDTKTRLLP